MKKTICVLMVVWLFISLPGCGKEIHYWEPLYPVENVIEIKIIELEGNSVLSDNDYTLRKEIEFADIPDIWNELLSIEYKRLAPSPGPVSGTAIMIVYESDEYEIISRYSRRKYAFSEDHGHIMEFHSYDRCRDAEQFDRIIENWFIGVANTEENSN